MSRRYSVNLSGVKPVRDSVTLFQTLRRLHQHTRMDRPYGMRRLS